MVVGRPFAEGRDPLFSCSYPGEESEIREVRDSVEATVCYLERPVSALAGALKAKGPAGRRWGPRALKSREGARGRPVRARPTVQPPQIHLALGTTRICLYSLQVPINNLNGGNNS